MGINGSRPSTNSRRWVPPDRGSRTFGLWSVALVFLMIASGLGTGVARAQTVGMRIAAAASVCSTPLHPPGTGPKEIRWCYTDLVGNKVRLWWDAAQPLAVQAANLAATEIPPPSGPG